ncbi:MAG: hypothetical protein Q4C95_02755 [Planctomycetia bacterium]|nr:hypothetical protein [Planctomycetia bacterium]
MKNNAKISTKDHTFQKRQLKRRFWVSLLLGIAGLAMLIGIYMTPQDTAASWSLAVWTLAWLIAILSMFSVIWFALSDYLAIQLHYSNDREKRKIEKICLDYELEKYRQEADQKKTMPPKEK